MITIGRVHESAERQANRSRADSHLRQFMA